MRVKIHYPDDVVEESMTPVNPMVGDLWDEYDVLMTVSSRRWVNKTLNVYLETCPCPHCEYSDHVYPDCNCKKLRR